MTAANCFAHIEDVHAIVEGILDLLGARRRVHFRIALSHRAARPAAIRHHLSRAPALLFAQQPRQPAAACTGSKSFTRGRSRRMAARSASMPRARACSPVNDSVGKMLAAEPRGEAMLARLQDLPRRRDAVEAAAARHDPRPQGGGRAHLRHQRAVARLDAGQLSRSRRGDHRLRLRDRGLAQDRQVHAGDVDPGGRGKPAVRRSAGLRHHLLLAHRRRACAEAAGQGLSGKLVTPLPVPHEL